MNKIAQNQIPLSPKGGFSGPGQLGTNVAGREVSLLTTILSTVIGVMTAVAFIWFVIQFMIGAVGWIMSGGDKGKVESARGKITTGAIGLVIVISAVFLASFVGDVFDLPILNVSRWFEILTP